jgi:hypothetical protein
MTPTAIAVVGETAGSAYTAVPGSAGSAVERPPTPGSRR